LVIGLGGSAPNVRPGLIDIAPWSLELGGRTAVVLGPEVEEGKGYCDGMWL